MTKHDKYTAILGRCASWLDCAITQEQVDFTHRPTSKIDRQKFIVYYAMSYNFYSWLLMSFRASINSGALGFAASLTVG
jgi:hypothetical protein